MLAIDTEVPAHYLFIVARNRPDILARVRERLRDDLRIEVIVDRRRGERRTGPVAQIPERRRADRRRPTRHWDDLSVYPTLVVQKRVESYAELQERVMASEREAHALRADNDRLSADNDRLNADNARLREAIVSMERRVEAVAAADASLKADAAAMLAQAEEVIGALLVRFRERLHPPPRTAS
jgi:regulator of replication initiation timing